MLGFINLDYDDLNFVADCKGGIGAPIGTHFKQSLDTCFGLYVGTVSFDGGDPTTNDGTDWVTLRNAFPGRIGHA